ncbi:hypothetical protein DI487_00175 [Flavobacterium sediminis]|uniref:Uncharacterized protein n=1 Tax=Flavobacterium sediminis TaxID=2201181 RepID=A0A2U8QQV0_9FLAO|nr:hypothetical protein [Flavobacterium sediminis]AWM12448.1 hypothetical protein DI487_00175 [Flavobacterium sediminis]
MKLKYQDKINEIDNCPLANERGSVKVIRVGKSNPATNEDLKPHAILFPKYKDLCQAWGLSVFKYPTTSDDIKNILPRKLSERFDKTHVFTITDSMGVKYQIGDNQSHYTFFPNEGIDLLSTFVTNNL